MSNPDIAIMMLLKEEGGYTDIPGDMGGATNFGINQRFFDSIGGFNNKKHVKELTQDDAIQIYKIHWWEKYEYSRILNQSIATKILSFSVNQGPHMAHQALQYAVRCASGIKLNIDGMLGQKTFDSVNNCNQEILLASFKSEAACYYKRIGNKQFLEGWLNRAYS